jgi:hypothetical protein
MITYEYVEPKRTPDEATRFLKDVLFPLCAEFWDSGGRQYFGADRWDVPLIEFIEMWMGGTLVIIAAADGQGAAQGFLIGGLVRPFFYQAKILKIEVWYGRTPEVERGLFAHLASILKYFSVDRVSVPDFGRGRPEIAGLARTLEQPVRILAR